MEKMTTAPQHYTLIGFTSSGKAIKENLDNWDEVLEVSQQFILRCISKISIEYYNEQGLQGSAFKYYNPMTETFELVKKVKGKRLMLIGGDVVTID